MKTSRIQILLLAAFTLLAPWAAPAAATNSLVWRADSDQISADIRDEALWPLLEDIAHQTGWHIFVEPGASHDASVKFQNLPAGVALRKLLGNLNYAMVPQTNGPQELYVFKTTMRAATQRVAAVKAQLLPMRHVANQLLIKLKHGANIDLIAKERGAKVVGRNDKLGIYLLEFADAAATDAALAGLKASPDVESVDYNYIYDAPVTPQPLSSVPPGVKPPTLTADANNSSDPCEPTIGLIDTGVQSLGSKLDAFVSTRTNVTGVATTLSSSTITHGTAMAETILNAIQQQNSSSSVRIYSVDVYGNSETTTTWNVALGVQSAVDAGASVLNLSLAGTTDSAILDDIIQQALAKGVVIFAAAGNQPVSTDTYPAAISGVNAVTALSAPGQLASYANYGSFVDLALPGASVVYLGDQAYVVQGTSSSTAYASGIAAGTKSVNCLSWPDIESAMLKKFTVPSN